MVYGTSGIWMWSTLPGLDWTTEKLWDLSSQRWPLLLQPPCFPCLLLWAHIILFLLRLRKAKSPDFYTILLCFFSRRSTSRFSQLNRSAQQQLSAQNLFQLVMPWATGHIIRTGVKWVGPLDLFLNTERLWIFNAAKYLCLKSYSLHHRLETASTHWIYENITVLFCLLSSVWRPLFHLFCLLFSLFLF